MRVTFLIGNGFDLNLGLNTSYSSFINEYRRKDSSSEPIRKLKNYMKSDGRVWAEAELAMGKFTDQFETGEGNDFSVAYEDFYSNLAVYLKRQEARINYIVSEDKIKRAFTHLDDFTSCFPKKEKGVFDDLFRKNFSESVIFQFLCFNYTRTLDECLDIVKNKHVDVGSHRYKGDLIKNSIGSVCHVHGTVNENMIFAVDDESQIANLSVFECEDGDLRKNLMIKKQANEIFQDNTDEEAKKILEQSLIVYIYGMSIGLTDKSWWKRICDWLMVDNDRHVIIQKYDLQEKGAFPLSYHIIERRQRKTFLNFGECEENVKTELEDRVHITGDNLFKDIKGIV